MFKLFELFESVFNDANTPQRRLFDVIHCWKMTSNRQPYSTSDLESPQINMLHCNSPAYKCIGDIFNSRDVPNGKRNTDGFSHSSLLSFPSENTTETQHRRVSYCCAFTSITNGRMVNTCRLLNNIIDEVNSKSTVGLDVRCYRECLPWLN